MTSTGEHYDVVIIGSGPGGGTMAWRLAQTGKRILLLERGDYLPRERENWVSQAVFVDARYQALETWYSSDGKNFHPGLHYFVGGNSKVYGAVLLRLRERDFDEIRHIDGISPAWPLKYDVFEPYYQAAEELYYVHGLRGEAPTEPPSDSSPASVTVTEFPSEAFSFAPDPSVSRPLVVTEPVPVAVVVVGRHPFAAFANPFDRPAQFARRPQRQRIFREMPALHAEAGAERRFAQTDRRALADAIERVAQTDGRGGLAFTRRCRADAGDQQNPQADRHIHIGAALPQCRQCRGKERPPGVGDRRHRDIPRRMPRI